jgi:PAS domain S-box-containing protein
VEKTVDNPGSERAHSERTGILGNLAQRLQEGLRATVVALGQSHSQRLAAIVESSDDAILSVDLDGTIATWNRGAEDLLGYDAEEIIGKSATVLIPPDRQGEERKLLERVAGGEHIQHYETERLRKDGRSAPVSLSISPIVDAAGTIIGASKIARDIGQRKRAEAALARRAEEQAALYQFTDRLFRAASQGDIYDAALDAIVRALRCERASILLFDESGVMKFVAWRDLSDGYRRAVEGHSPWTRDTRDPQPVAVGDVERADLDAALEATVKAEGIGALAFIPLTAKGSLIGKFMTYYGAPHTFTDAEIELAVTIARQLGFALERVRADETKALVLNESRHRIKNTLAMVQAIAGQTLQRTPPEERDAFMARLGALGEAHELLTSEHWDQAPVREIVSRALKPFAADEQERFDLQGPLVWLPASSSLALTLCLHELATNAAKYGALSNRAGRVHVTWEPTGEEQRKVRLTWRESGGPPVSAPDRKGFGSLLMETSFGREGQSCFEFRPEGLRCSMELALQQRW